jgi:hypothetical protein
MKRTTRHGAWILVGALLGVQVSNAQTCPSDIKLCEIVGHVEGATGKRYSISCAGFDVGFETGAGGGLVVVLDSISRQEIRKCKVSGDWKAVVSRYETKTQEIQNPKCYLTQWKGQMMFVEGDERGRCSFSMNERKANEFRAATGVEPLYQCEHERFLFIKDKTAPKIYKKSRRGNWVVACQASIRVGESVDTIDWNNPPKYYSPSI